MWLPTARKAKYFLAVKKPPAGGFFLLMVKAKFSVVEFAKGRAWCGRVGGC